MCAFSPAMLRLSFAITRDKWSLGLLGFKLLADDDQPEQDWVLVAPPGSAEDHAMSILLAFAQATMRRPRQLAINPVAGFLPSLFDLDPDDFDPIIPPLLGP